nr:hypothetical protein BaRGS_011039 [Batillaria attramentaria]
MAIGVEGGFQVDDKKFVFEEQTAVVVLPQWHEISLPNPDLPEQVQLSVTMILSAEDAAKQEEAMAMAGTWEGEKLQVSKHAETLVQLDNGKRIPPSGWKCERCDLTTNLWLNLTDGAILYVFSYDEDDMVEDPKLTEHLRHFGINVAALEKTDKTMVELEIDLNQRIGEWDVIQEAGSQLTPLYGPGYTGMRNLGNSCYMNSVMQVLFTIPDFQRSEQVAVRKIQQTASAEVAAFEAKKQDLESKGQKITTRLATFPDYLVIQLKKFTIGEDWTPKKLDVKIDGAIVGQLVEMGFAPEGCKKAVFHTKSSGIEPAMNWVMEHMGDADFADPFVQPGRGAAKPSEFVPNEEAVAMIASMGFSPAQAIKALKATDNNVERAADWIFSHADELDQPDTVPMETQEGSSPQKFRDGSGHYKLVAFISHMGTSTSVGHYVCHILRDNRWVIYNDEKVAQSEHPPRDLAYLYLFQRA